MEGQTQFSPHPQVPAKLNKPLVILLIFVALMAAGAYYFYMDMKQAKLGAEIELKFANYLEQDRYTEAGTIYKTLAEQGLGSRLLKTQSELNSLLANKIADITTAIVNEKDNTFSTCQRVKELANIKELTVVEDTFNSEVRKLTAEYLEQKLTYSRMEYLFLNMVQLGFFTDSIQQNKVIVEKAQASRQYTGQGMELAGKADFFGALQMYLKVTEEDQRNYQLTRENIQQCVDKIYALAEKLGKQGRYAEAEESLSKLGALFPEDKEIPQKISAMQTARQEEEKNLVPYHGPVQHIFFHPLIAFPELTFDGDLQARGFNEWFVTVPEFKKIIESLYAKGFILIDLADLYEIKVSNGQETILPKPLLLPKGKRPLVMSIDDLNYYRYMIQNGTVHKLILDQEGKIATYSKTSEGEELVAYDNEIVPLLDSFVDAHPDFSFRGAKGVIALTGYEGILGYRTDELESPAFAKEKEEALKVVQALKDNGWSFASHGYGHLNTRDDTLARIVRDTERWQKEVESLIGHTDIYIYPFGASVKPEDPKFKALQQAGFKVFCSVGPNPYLKYFDQYILMDRRHIDGIALYLQADSMRDLFESEQIIDPLRPPL